MAVLRRLSVARRTHAVTTVDSLVAFVSDSRFRISSCTSPAQLQHRLGSVEKSGREDDVGGCKSGLDYPLVSSAFSPPRRDCHIVSSLLSSAFGRGLNEGSRRPLDGLRSRLLATKAKRPKGKVENVESVEDTAGTAKGNALRLMETALDVLCREHSKLRTGRASAGMLDHITVEAHGVRTPLNHIAAVTVSGLQILNVLPYDASMVKEVEKAILNSPMGLNPQVDGVTMTVPLPRLTKEHCETMCKLVSKAGESAKLTIRRARKEALDMVKSSGDLSKDEMKRFEKEVEELTKKYTKLIDETCKNKEKEIMA